MTLTDPWAQRFLAAGFVLWTVNAVAKRRRLDLLYRATYFSGWPVLGTGVMMAVASPPRRALNARFYY